MEVADTFIPTAGVVGILPVFTYFVLLVTLFVSTGSFISSLTVLPHTRPEHRLACATTAVVALLTAFTYYISQTYYRDMLSELVTVTEATDRQTLIRESYNAIGQYRYVSWCIMAPLLLHRLTVKFKVQSTNERGMATLLVAGSVLYFVSYIGHQQLSFDNEIQTGAKLIWGLLATIIYGFILFTLSQLRKQSNQLMPPATQRPFQQLTRTVTVCWGIYLFGYFLTLTTIDFNWIHLLLSVTDLISVVSLAVTAHWGSQPPKLIRYR